MGSLIALPMICIFEEGKKMQILNDLFIRIHGHGELINQTHYENMVNMAKWNPRTTFALWTKRYDIVKKYHDQHGDVPENMILIYSNPIVGKIMTKPPKYFHKTFNNVWEDEHKDQQNCTGQKCADCMLCYNHNDTNVIVEKVKRAKVKVTNICKACYSHNMLNGFRKNTQKPLQRNSDLLGNHLLEKWQQSMVHISKMSGKLQGLRAINTNTVTNDYCIKQYNK